MQHKSFYLTLFLLTSTILVHGQGFFNQKGEMIKKCMEQIALFKSQHSALNAGYDIKNNGIEQTNSYKDGEFSLHENYYSSLNTVSDPVKNDPVVKQTLDLYGKIDNDKNTTYHKAQKSGLFTTDELTYMRDVCLHMGQAADQDLNELKLLVTGGILQMTDDQRLKGINRVYQNIQKKYRVVTDFNQQVMTALNGRKDQKKQVETLKKLYGQ